MTTFRVHYVTDFGKFTVPVVAETPAEAAIAVRKTTPSAVILKVKRDRSGTNH
jgi:hypothetical protein